MPCKIFILEDNKDRRYLFRKILPMLFGKDIIITISDNVEEAKKLYDDSYDIIFLDHDLDNRVYIDPTEKNTGYQFAKFLIEQDGIEDKKIYIHTMNPYGGDAINDLLPNAQRIPFSQFIKGFENVY
jgi:CheY-like chemotaxis protein